MDCTTFCDADDVLQTKVVVQCDKLAMVELSWNTSWRSICRGKKAESLAVFRVGTRFQRELPLSLEIPEFPYNI